MAVEIGWQSGPAGRSAVWLMDHGQWVRQLFELEAPDEDGRTIVEDWAEKAESIEEFLEMMHLEGFIDLETFRRLLSEHAPLRRIWEKLREFCRDAGDIGDYPVTQIIVVPHPFPHDPAQAVLPQEYVTATLQAWERYESGHPEALSTPTLGIVLADVGILVGRRLGLSQDQAVHFADWLVGAITGWSIGHGNDRTILRLEDAASRAAYGDAYVQGRAFCTPDFWSTYRPAIPAVVSLLKDII
jgi:hypothetical protein